MEKLTIHELGAVAGGTGAIPLPPDSGGDAPIPGPHIPPGGFGRGPLPSVQLPLVPLSLD